MSQYPGTRRGRGVRGGGRDFQAGRRGRKFDVRRTPRAEQQFRRQMERRFREVRRFQKIGKYRRNISIGDENQGSRAAAPRRGRKARFGAKGLADPRKVIPRHSVPAWVAQQMLQLAFAQLEALQREHERDVARMIRPSIQIAGDQNFQVRLCYSVPNPTGRLVAASIGAGSSTAPAPCFFPFSADAGFQELPVTWVDGDRRLDIREVDAVNDPQTGSFENYWQEEAVGDRQVSARAHTQVKQREHIAMLPQAYPPGVVPELPPKVSVREAARQRANEFPEGRQTATGVVVDPPSPRPRVVTHVLSEGVPGRRSSGSEIRNPPGKDAVEGKFSGAKEFLRPLKKVLSRGTEFCDVVDALFEGLPRPERVGSSRRGRYYRLKRARCAEKFRHVVRNFHLIDWDIAFKALLLNEVEDLVYGQLNRLAGAAAVAGGLATAQVGFGGSRRGLDRLVTDEEEIEPYTLDRMFEDLEAIFAPPVDELPEAFDFSEFSRPVENMAQAYETVARLDRKRFFRRQNFR